MATTKQEVLDELKALHQEYSNASRRVLALSMKVQNMPDSAFADRKVIQLAIPESITAPEDVLAFIKKAGYEFTYTAHPTHTQAQQAAATWPNPNDGVLVDGKTTQPNGLVTGLDITKLTPAARAALASAEAASQSQAAPMMSERTIFIPQMNTQEVIDAARNAPSPMQVALSSAQSLLKEAMRNAGTPQHVIDLVDKVSVEHLGQKTKGADFVVPAADMPRELNEGKTEMPDEAQVQAEVEQGILSAFIGRGSLFMEHLHNSMLFGARGELQAGYELADGKLMKRFENDAFWAESRVLPKWPTGFYLDRDTKQLQFLANTDQFACLLTALPSEHSPVKIYFYGMPDGWKDIAEFSLNEQKLIHAKVSDTLVGLKKK